MKVTCLPLGPVCANCYVACDGSGNGVVVDPVSLTEELKNIESRVLGAKERVEAHFRKPLPQLREQLVDVMRNNYIVQQVQQSSL